MKIVVIPGVGLHKQDDDYEYFMESICKDLCCEGEVFKWDHSLDHPDYTLPLGFARRFISEAILDLVNEAEKLEVPEADVYLGHSGGSLVALSQSNAPAVTFGSPAALVNFIKDDKVEAFSELIFNTNNNRPVLNLINKYDLLSYPINKGNVENYVFSGSWINPFTYSPVNAHRSYWRSSRAIKKVVKTLENWGIK